MSLKTWKIIFIQLSDLDYITVKKSSRTPEEVLKSLKLPCDAIKTILGTFHLEKSIKAEFEPHRVSNYEGWYHPVPEVLERINSIEDYDGEKPPKPKPEPKPRRYEQVDRDACCGCGTWLSDEYNEKRIEVLTLGESETYIDYGEIHDEMEVMNADAWSKSDDYLCRECALKGGLTNLIFPLFTNIRENLSPFWTQTDEKFLAMCVDTAEILETTRYIWVKARVFTRKCLAAFIEQNPSGNLNAAIRFIFAEIRRIDSANLSESESNPKN